MFSAAFWLKKQGGKKQKNMEKVAEMSGKTVIYNGLAGLFEAWDSVPSLRERCRSYGCLVLEFPSPGEKEQKPAGAIAKTISNAKYNYHALAPLLQSMKDCRYAVPCIETLGGELTKLMRAHGFNPDCKEISDQAWSIRYLYGVVKGLQYKDAPPKATWTNLALTFENFFYVIVFLQNHGLQNALGWQPAGFAEPLGLGFEEVDQKGLPGFGV